VIDFLIYYSDCKSAGNAYGGSNPPAPTIVKKSWISKAFFILCPINAATLSEAPKGKLRHFWVFLGILLGGKLGMIELNGSHFLFALF